jgi:hypothetical protein
MTPSLATAEIVLILQRPVLHVRTDSPDTITRCRLRQGVRWSWLKSLEVSEDRAAATINADVRKEEVLLRRHGVVPPKYIIEANPGHLRNDGTTLLLYTCIMNDLEMTDFEISP